jgi:PAS domain-containing protein
LNGLRLQFKASYQLYDTQAALPPSTLRGTQIDITANFGETDQSLPSPGDMMLAIDNLGTTGAAAPCAARIDQDTGYEDFLHLAEASAAMIWLADKDGLCTFANQRWLEFRGRTLDQEIGTGWSQGIHPEDSLSVMADYWAALNARTPLRV